MDAISEAKKLFNETWDLLDKADRTDDDKADMLHRAHASCLLWRGAGNPANDARGEWQVSRVYSVLGYGEPALLHGRRSLDICLKNGIGDFDLAFGHEAVARAYAVCGDADKKDEHKKLGIAACEKIEKDGDRSYALGELNGIN